MPYSWSLIEQDPVLSNELHRIEQIPATDDALIRELLEFYSRVDRLFIQGLIFAPEESEPVWKNA